VSILPPAEKLMKTFDLPVADEYLLDWPVTWSAISKMDKLYSPAFMCGGVEWRLLVFPSGNRPGLEAISVFLECSTAAQQEDPRFASCASFLVLLRNYQTDQIRLEHHEASHRFTKKDGDWGFSAFAPHKALSKVLQDDKLMFTVIVKVYKDELGTLWHKFDE
jgi:ubiquitin carboxyl-terminal hydrolase 7